MGVRVGMQGFEAPATAYLVDVLRRLVIVS